MTTRYYVHGSSGAVEGPFEAKIIRKKLQAKEVSANTQVCAEGTEHWQALSSVRELGGPGGSPTPPSAPPPLVTASTPRPSYVGPVLTTIFCCVVGGIVAIVYTGKAHNALVLGDMAAYHRAMGVRQAWIIVGVVLGVLVGCLNFVPPAMDV